MGARIDIDLTAIRSYEQEILIKHLYTYHNREGSIACDFMSEFSA